LTCKQLVLLGLRRSSNPNKCTVLFLFQVCKPTIYAIVATSYTIDWAPSSASLMSPTMTKYNTLRSWIHATRQIELGYIKTQDVCKPARNPPISYVHHSTHSMSMLGRAKRMKAPHSCRQSRDQPNVRHRWRSAKKIRQFQHLWQCVIKWTMTHRNISVNSPLHRLID